MREKRVRVRLRPRELDMVKLYRKRGVLGLLGEEYPQHVLISRLDLGILVKKAEALDLLEASKLSELRIRATQSGLILPG